MQDILALATANLLSPAVLFFALGFLGTMAGSQLTLPEAVAKTLSIYLMLAIGFKGGVAVAEHGLGIDIALALIAGVVLSASIPLVAFGLLTVMAPARPRRPGCRCRALRVDFHRHLRRRQRGPAAGWPEFRGVSGGGGGGDGDARHPGGALSRPFRRHALGIDRQVRCRRRKPDGGRSCSIPPSSSWSVPSSSATSPAPKGLADIGPFIVDPFKGVLCLFLLDNGCGGWPRHPVRLEAHEPGSGGFRTGHALCRRRAGATRWSRHRALHRRRRAADGARRLGVLHCRSGRAQACAAAGPAVDPI